MASARLRSGLFMGFGAFAVVTGAVMAILWPLIFMSQLQNMLILTNTSMSFDLWREVPVPIYLECFMWNVTNVDDILAGKNVTLKVEQLGPYVYREFNSKEDIVWNDNDTVTFYTKRTWHFMPEMSNGSLSDKVTNVNPIVVIASYFVRNRSTLVKLPVDVALRMYHDNIFITANVSSWLFDGIDDHLLDIVHRIPDLPFHIPFDKFAWFPERNGTKGFDGIFVMNTGSGDFSQLGNVEMWRNSDRTPYRDECGEVRGSAGELWAPERGQPEIELFVPDICTFMRLSKNDSIEVHGVSGVTYSANSSLFDNGYNYPKLACYCDEVRDENCVPPGALNVSSCLYGAPLFVSLPHMLHADRHYPSKVDGMDPTDQYNMRLSLEMITGMPLAVSAQLQINLLVRHITAISINNALPDPDTMVPMFWFRQELEMTEEYAALARRALNIRFGVPIGFYVLTAIGVALLVTGIVILVRKLMKSPDTTPILADSADDEQQ